MQSKQHQPARILVIEDSSADILLLRHALDAQGDDYEIEVLRDGAEALEFVAAQRTFQDESHPCVIVLDLHLPKHNGLIVLEAIKQQPALLHIHVVALSSYTSPHDQAEVMALGVRRYCEKPSDLDSWLTLASDILALCRESTATAMAHG